MASMTFIVNDTSTGGDNPQVRITITENADGTVRFDIVQIVAAGAYLGDLRGFFFDLADESLLGSLAVSPVLGPLTEFKQGNDSIKDLGNGANMQGLLGSSGGYDAGVEIGGSGIGKDDIRNFSFTLDSTARNLTLDDFANMDFGVRITSVGRDTNGDGTIDGCRDGSSKIAETTFDPVTAVNDAAGNVLEDTCVTGNVLSNDTGPGTKVLLNVVYNATTYSFSGSNPIVITLPSGATVTIWSNGNYKIDANGADGLDSGETANFSIKYTVQQTVSGDGGVATDEALLTGTIVGVDDQPTLAVVASGSIAEITQSAATIDAGLSGTLVGADADVEPLTYGIVGGTENGDGTVSKIGAFGTLTVNTTTGAYSYAKNTAAIEALDDSETPSDAFTVSVSDGDGPLVTQSYTVNLAGADDVPTLAAVTAGSIAEVDQSSATTDLGLSGTLAGADVDVEALTYGIVGGTDNGDGTVSLIGSFGTLTVNTSTGAYSYAKNALAIEPLDDGETPSDAFTVSVSDGDGPDVTQTYTVNLAGADDAPTLAAVTAGSVAEVDQSSTTMDLGLSGTLAGADVDIEALTYGIVGGSDNGDGTVSLAGSFGTLTVNTMTGAYSYAKNAAAIEALDDSETPTDSFTVSVSDGDGPDVTQTYTVNLAGADDAPTLAAVASGSIAEVDQSSATTDLGLSGTLAGADVDIEALSYGIVGGTDNGDGTVSLAGSFGTLTLNTTTGAYSYTKNAAAIEALDDGETPSDAFTMGVSDGDGLLVTQNYTVNLTGADDAPTLAAVASGSVAEVDQSSATNDLGLSGTLAGADVDVEALSYGIVGGTDNGDGTVSLAGSFGTLTVNTTTGAYSFAKNDAAIEALDDTETPTDSFTVSVSDGDGPAVTQTYAINLAGADDAPTLAAVTSGSVAEVDQSSATNDLGLSGTLAGADVDAETLSYGIVGGTDNGDGTVGLAGSFGTLTVNTSTGAYSYAKNAAAIEALDDGETPSDAFTVSVSDGDGPDVTQSYTVNFTGADDAPTLAALAPGSIAEVDQSSATTDLGLSGTLAGADVDVETLSYGIVGGTDNGDGTVSLAGSFGTLTVNTATGAYSYAKNAAAIEALDDGETPSDAFTVSVSDGDGPDVTQSYTVNLTGADDAPTLAAVASGSIAEVDQSAATTDLGLSGTLAGADVDVETLSYGIVGGTDNGDGTVSLVGSFGTLTVNTTTGAYSYAKNALAIEALDAGETPSDAFTVSVSDGDGPDVTQTYTVNLAGADDAPTLAAVTSGSIVEVNQSSATNDLGLSGTLAGADVDVETLSYGIVGGSDNGDGTVSLVGSFGTLTVNTTTGAYSYAKNALAIEALDAGETPSDAFTVSVSDGDGPDVTQTYTVNLAGADDAPTLAAVTAGSIAEVDQSSATSDLGLSGTLAGADVDVETLSYGIVGGTDNGDGTVGLAGSFGTLTVNTSTGAYSYAKNAAAIEALDDGETPSDAFTVSVSDGDGPDVTQSYTVNLAGDDDAPTLAALAPGSIAEVDQSSATMDLGLSGTLSGADVDVEALSYGIVGGTDNGDGTMSLAGSFGTLTVNTTTGAYSYTKNATAIEALDDAETPTDSFTVSVSDGDGPDVTQTYTVNLAGADDAPTLAAVTAGSIAEVDQSSATNDLGLSGTLAGADVDVETLSYGIVGGSDNGDGTVSLAGLFGTLTVNTTSGAYSFAKNAAAIEALDAGETPTDSFTVSVSDGDGPLVTQSYTVNLAGADDAPTLAAVTAGSIAEVDQSSATNDLGLSGTLAGADVDVETLSYGIVGGTDNGDGTVSLAGSFGTLTVNTTTGAYSYAKNTAAIEALDGGETPTDSFTVSVSDGDGPLVTQNYAVNLAGADDAPTLTAVTSGSVAEVDQSSATNDLGLSGTLVGADVDVEALSYGIAGGTDNGDGTVSLAGSFGTLTVNTTTGAYSYAKNAAAIEALDDGETPTDSFTVSVSDGDGPLVTQSYTVNLTGANDAPTSTNDSRSTNEDTSVLLGLGDFGTFADIDGDTLAAVKIVALPADGVLQYDSTGLGAWIAVTANQSISAADIVAGRLRFSPDANENGPAYAQIGFQVSDGDALSASYTLTIDVAAVNDAPVLDATKTPVGAAVLEDAGAPVGAVGTLVSALIDFNPPASGLNNVSDVDAGALTGIAVTGSNNANGTWWYSTNNGSSWSLLGTVNDDGARLLAADGATRVYFQPAANFDGDAAITFRAWDQTSGTNGGIADTTPAGGASAFSTATDTASFDVTPAADAPIITAPHIIYWTDNGSGVFSPINRISFQDVDSAGATVRVTLSMDDLADDFVAATGGGVTVAGSGTSVMTLDGTIAAINAFLYGGNVTWDPSGGAGQSGVLTATIDDNGTVAGGNVVVATPINITSVSPNFANDSSNDFSGVNFTDIDSDPDGAGGAGDGNDTMITSWSHQPLTASAPVVYDGGGSGTDTITLVMTPDQLAAVLSVAADQNDLRDYFDGTPAGDSLGLNDTLWNADVVGFEVANISLATGYGVGSYSINSFFDQLPAADTTPDADTANDLVIGTAAGETLSGGAGAAGLNGDDVLVGLGGNDNLSGGSGADLLLGGDGDDALTGGAGTDVLAGGRGADTFFITETATADDLLDYSFVEGDAIDLSALLDVNFGPASAMADFARVQQSGSNLVVQVDLDGAVGGANWVTVATLVNYNSAGNDPLKLIFEGSEFNLMG